MVKKSDDPGNREGKMLTIDSILWLISVKFLEASLSKSSYSLSLVNDNVL